MNALVLSAVLAATPITLQQVRQESRNNLQALLSELDRVRASEQKRVATASMLPQVQLQSSATRLTTSKYSAIATVASSVDSSGNISYRNAITDLPGYAANNFTLGATLTQLLFDLGKFKLLEQAGHLEDAARGSTAEQILTS